MGASTDELEGEPAAVAERERVSLTVTSVDFSGGQQVPLEPDTILVLVGPNNAGKSRALREIRRHLRRDRPNRVVTNVGVRMTGKKSDVQEWVQKHFVNTERDTYKGIAGTISEEDIKRWGTLPAPLGIVDHLCALAKAEQRFDLLRVPALINPLTDPETHPLHFLLTQNSTEEWLGSLVQQSFAVDVIVNRAAGDKMQLHCGERPKFADRVGKEYLRALYDLPTLENQGDGLRSFYACLVQVLLGASSLVLLDEPEMFLHPPQAEQLGEILARDAPENRQLVVATHSSDLLRGMLKHAARRIKLVRITRERNVNNAFELTPDGVAALWQDPYLRFTNALDSLFHQSVVVCESDADCRFYDAMYEAMFPDATRPMFVPSGGKQGLKRLSSTLKSLGVPCSAIADFDVLNDRNVVRALWESVGGNWSELESRWSSVRSAIETASTVPHRGKVLEDMRALLKGPPNEPITEREMERIREIARTTSGWARAKHNGLAALPQGAATEAGAKLLDEMRARRLFVVPVGELERFAPAIGGKSGAWVTAVLETYDLATDSALADARNFIGLLAAADNVRQPERARVQRPVRRYFVRARQRLDEKVRQRDVAFVLWMVLIFIACMVIPWNCSRAIKYLGM